MYRRKWIPVVDVNIWSPSPESSLAYTGTPKHRQQPREQRLHQERFFKISPSPFSKGWSSTTDLIKTLALSDRGVIVHWKGFGWLTFDGPITIWFSSSWNDNKIDSRYLINPGVNSWTGSISLPFLSFAFRMLNAATVIATVINTVLSPSSFPGHILESR